MDEVNEEAVLGSRECILDESLETGEEGRKNDMGIFRREDIIIIIVVLV